MMLQLIFDIKREISQAIISAKFHNTIAQSLLKTALIANQSTSLKNVALSGGVFCNRYLYQLTINLLKKNDFNVLLSDLPCNDAAISAGQAAIAASLQTK